MQALSSIIICCYNGAKFIDHCFQCILSQTYKNIEIIFVDDGSIDDSYQIAKSYSEKFQTEGMNLICLHQGNKGAGGAAALGFQYVTGEYLSCFDVDDTLYPTSIEKRVDFLEKNPNYTIVRTNGFKANSDKHTKHLFINTDTEKRNKQIFEDLLFGKTNNWSGSYMIRTSALLKIYPDKKIYESRYGQNMQFLLAASYQNLCGFIDEPLMEYEYNPESFTRNEVNYQSKVEKTLGFKDIRVSILQSLNIYENYREKLNRYYKGLLLELAIHYNQKEEYIKILSDYPKPYKLEYTYYYHLYRGNSRKALFYKICLYIKSLISR